MMFFELQLRLALISKGVWWFLNLKDDPSIMLSHNLHFAPLHFFTPWVVVVLKWADVRIFFKFLGCLLLLMISVFSRIFWMFSLLLMMFRFLMMVGNISGLHLLYVDI